MANEEHVQKLKSGVEPWNYWRTTYTRIQPDLAGANLTGANLRGANLNRANLNRANLKGANLNRATLSGAYLIEANLSRANLSAANLIEATLIGTHLNLANLSGANLSGANLDGAYLIEANLSGTILSAAHLSGANLSGANLIRAILTAATLTGANLVEVDLTKADLSGANLTNVDLSGAKLGGTSLRGTLLIKTNLENADLAGCRVYGVSAWDVQVNEQTKQENLIVTSGGEAIVAVDNIKVAQFIYLLLNNKEVRDIIDTITSKAVLILGRFTSERKEVLDALRNALRRLGYVPLLFDFDRPTDRDFTETIMTLAGMSCFVIADITNPKSSPLELQATVPNYMIPFVPILKEGERPFSMFRDLHLKYEWVLPPRSYNTSATLIQRLNNAVVVPALQKRRELALKKAQDLPIQDVSDYPEDDELSSFTGDGD
jgi:uncharacterized protein YjbI with pentapeptide repeats